MASSSHEETLALHLRSCGIRFEREYVIPSGRRKFRYDFFVPGKNLLVEVQGGLHLGKIGGHTSERGVTRDYAKMRYAQTNGYVLFAFSPKEIKSGKAITEIEQYKPKSQSKENQC